MAGLSISRKAGEAFIFDLSACRFAGCDIDNVRVEVVSTHRGKVQLRVHAPRWLKVLREELALREHEAACMSQLDAMVEREQHCENATGGAAAAKPRRVAIGVRNAGEFEPFRVDAKEGTDAAEAAAG